MADTDAPAKVCLRAAVAQSLAVEPANAAAAKEAAEDGVEFGGTVPAGERVDRLFAAAGARGDVIDLVSTDSASRSRSCSPSRSRGRRSSSRRPRRSPRMGSRGRRQGSRSLLRASEPYLGRAG